MFAYIQTEMKPKAPQKFSVSKCFCGHEQLISNGERLKPAFGEGDKKQTMIDLRGISNK